MKDVDVLVRGAGIVGQSLALALARLGLRVALRGRTSNPDRPPRPDVRAYALSAASVALLRDLKVWDALPVEARTAVDEMQVHGDAQGAALEFSAWQQRTGELAWITDAALLEQALAEALRYAPNVERVTDDVPAALTAHCEGRDDAPMRRALGIEVERHDYHQTAIAARLTSNRPHAGVARQWFRAPDVLALLPFDAPLPGASYALVWSLPNERAQALMALPPAEFAQALQEATGDPSLVLTLASERAAWPLLRSRANRWCGPGWVLLGDAAHVVHPLAGQGLNLGLADVAALAGVIGRREPWRPLGDERLLRRYVRERAAPTWAMTQATDALAALFSHPAPLARELRNRGLTLVNQLAPVKRWLTARALDS
jgi:2-polyprenyl-6-methoxyphenol hydroxylase-like FAD-dependent oxidoreductase